MIQYPVLSTIDTKPDDIIGGEALPPRKLIDDFLANLVPGSIISGATPPERDFVAPLLRAYGLWGKYFGEGKHLMPNTRIEDAEFFIPTHIMHGRGDTNVPVEGSRKFVERGRELFPGVRFEIVTPEGDHGFDGRIYEEDEEWLAEFLKGVEEDWLA